MSFLAKLIFFILSIGLGSEIVYDNEFYGFLLFFIGIIILLFMINDVINFIEDIKYGRDYKYKSHKIKHKYGYYNDYYDNYYYEDNNPNIIMYDGGSNNRNRSTTNQIKKIEKQIPINKNIIEIGNETEIVIDNEELEVDNTKKNKPKIHKSALEPIVEVKHVPAVIKKDDGKKTCVLKDNNTSSACIFVTNKKEINRNTEKIYKILIHTFKKQELKPNQLYALMQSIFYVDVFSSSIVIYYNKLLLEKSGLSEDNLQKEKVCEYISKLFHDADYNIYFEAIEYVSLLDYHITKKDKK
ncbi:MAG: hypothetical protein IKT40_11940 [Bacilli bacterium]|nr:hypothetical protein [Bacilli bacterium]